MSAKDDLSPPQEAMHDIKDALGQAQAALTLALMQADEGSLVLLGSTLQGAKETALGVAKVVPEEAKALSAMLALLWPALEDAQEVVRRKN